MEKSRNMQVRLGILAAAAVVCFGLMPLGTRALFGQNSQNRDDARKNQDASAQDRDSQDRSNADSSDDEGTVTLPSGYVIPVRLADEVNSSHDKAGDLFTGAVDPSVLVNDHVVIPRGTEAHIRMVEDKKGGHLHGKAGQGISGGEKSSARRGCNGRESGRGGGSGDCGIFRGKS